MVQSKLSNIQPYKARFLRFVDKFTLSDWQIKLYWISWISEVPNQDLVKKSLEVIEKRLTSITHNFIHYNIGFAMIHEGKDGTYVIVSYWIEENMLDHIVFMLDPDHPDGFKRLQPDSIVTCVWELEVMYFEKKAWTAHVLKNAGDIEGYLENTLTVDV